MCYSIKSSLFALLVHSLFLGFSLGEGNREQHCLSFASSLAIERTTILAFGYHTQGLLLSLDGAHPTCTRGTTSIELSQDVCRIVLSVATSEDSATLVEAWLPDSWNGRTLSSGTGGISGCIDYSTLRVGSEIGFATFATNAGHNGSSGSDIFLNKPEVFIDWSYRGVHTEAEVAKSLTKQYYGLAPRSNYYSSCSNGGRQAHTEAAMYPNDFDGMLVGAPGIDLWRVVSLKGISVRRTGWPEINSDGYVSNEQWAAIVAAQVKELDLIDGVKDGIIDNPPGLKFDPAVLACGFGILNESLCLNAEQVVTVRNVYQPLANQAGQVIFPASEVGAPTSWWSANVVNNSAVFPYSILLDLFRSVVYNDTTWNANNFNETDMELAANLNPAESNGWFPDLSDFRNSGGKMLLYHGGADPAIPSDNTARFIAAAQSTMNLTIAQMQEFYRLFYIPGMSHCAGGEGPYDIGQTQGADRLPDSRLNSTTYNALLALVDWVEGGNAPSQIVGTRFADDQPGSAIQAQRAYCLYPSRSVWNGEGDPRLASSWNCTGPLAD